MRGMKISQTLMTSKDMTEAVRVEESFNIVIYGDKDRRIDEVWKTHLKSKLYTYLSTHKTAWDTLKGNSYVALNFLHNTYYAYWHEDEKKLEICINQKRKRNRSKKTETVQDDKDIPCETSTPKPITVPDKVLTDTKMTSLLSSVRVSKLLVVDVEGRGWPREIGAIFWDRETNQKNELLIQIPDDLQEELAQPLTDRKIGLDNPVYFELQQQFLYLNKMVRECDIVVAHNATFDKQMITAIEELRTFLDKKWICTMHDFCWNNGLGRKESLETICRRLDVPYKNAHRALGDCRLLVSCLIERKPLRDKLLRAYKNRTEAKRKHRELGFHQRVHLHKLWDQKPKNKYKTRKTTMELYLSQANDIGEPLPSSNESPPHTTTT